MIELKQVTGEPSASIDTCAPLGDLLDGGGYVIGLASIDRRNGTDLLGKGQLLGGNVDGDGMGAERGGDHDRREADAAAAVHRHPFATLDARLVGDGPEGGGEAAAEAGGGRKIHALRQMDEVLVGEIDRHILGERAPMGEARLELCFTDLLVAGAAFAATAAAGNERHGHAVADLVAHDRAASGGDRPRQFVARNMRQANVRVVPHPAMPIAPAEPGGLDLDDDAVLRR